VSRSADIVLALADAAAAPEPPLPPVADTDAAAAFEAWLAAAPRRNRTALRAALHALEVVPCAAGKRRFRRLDRAGRLATLRALQHSRVPAVPQLAEALRSAAVMSYHGDARVMAALGYDAAARVRQVRAARAATTHHAIAETPFNARESRQADGRRADGGDARESRQADGGDARESRQAGGVTDGSAVAGRVKLRADVCVIGAGAGGSVVAKELAEAGAAVVVLEEGGEHPAGTLTARPRDMLTRLYRDAGQTATIGRPPIVLPLGRGLGGTTLVNSGTCFRTPDHVLERWQAEHGLHDLTPRALEPVFDRVERTLGVAPVPPHLAGANAALIRRGAEALGWSGGYLRRNARGCQGSGVCAFGCPTGAKQHAGEAYLRPAHEAGARTYSHARVRALDRDGARITHVHATTAAGGRIEVAADTVVLAAGTIHTPLLLKAGGLGSRALGHNLSLHPATAVWGVFDDPVDMVRGVPQSYYVDEFARERVMIEGIAGPPDYLAMAAPFTGDEHRELLLEYRHVGQCGLMVSDRSRGRVTGKPGAPIIRYDLGPDDVHAVHTGLLRTAELLQAAGARRLILPLARLPELPDADLGPLRRLRPSRNELKLMAFHPLGTARAHADPEHGVVDGDLRVHGTSNLHVADGSAVPSALGVNPQITIMALATRLAFHLRSEPCPS
jgi:glycine/D-amino acid oxidase-like deaminating enzyme